MKIALATTGGDAPGMNAAIRAITRLGSSKGWQIVGFEKGYDGLLHNLFQPLNPRSVGGILERGGTILQTSRSDALKSNKGIDQISSNLNSHDIDVLVVIGGNGSFQAADILNSHSDIPIIGIPATIDNDVWGSEETIGFDTAVNTAVYQIDKIRDTATSHDRIFITEVMGRNHGFLAISVGLAVGAEIILIPEVPYDENMIIETIKENAAKGKKSGIIVTAEGVGDCRILAEKIESYLSDITVRINILGYTQRGGAPTARSRLLANHFAKEAVDLIDSGMHNKITVLNHGEISSVALRDSTSSVKQLDEELLELYKILAK